jgi:hypothetical protein
MAQVVERLPCHHKALYSNSSTAEEQKKKEKEESKTSHGLSENMCISYTRFLKKIIPRKSLKTKTKTHTGQ